MDHVVAAYQPRYYPRLHYLARARRADTFIVLDDVQFRRSSPQHRARIDYHGETWITIPVQREGSYVRIDEALIDMSCPWIKEHLRMIENVYGDDAAELRPFYEQLCPSVPEPDVLRDSSEELIASIHDDRLRNRLRAFQRAEDALGHTSTTGEELRREKNEIDTRIGRLKREDPNADISDLLDRSREIDDRLATLQEKRRNRNQRLVAVAEELTRHDVSLSSMPVEELWELDGIDPGELLDEVKLVDLTVPLLKELFRQFEITSDVVRSSNMDVTYPGDASKYLARLTEVLNGDSYLSGGVGYENYLDEEMFRDRDLDVIVQDWTPSWDGGNVCALEVLFNCDEPGRYVRCDNGNEGSAHD